MSIKKSKKKDNPNSKKTVEKKPTLANEKVNESSTKDSKVKDTVKKPKSASEASISHFSSISTPEYREGWNRIFGNNQDKVESEFGRKVMKVGSQEFLIADKDVVPELKKSLRQAFHQHASEQGFDLLEIERSMHVTYSLKCTVSEKK